MTGKVLVTRPLPQARDFADQLKSNGFDPVLCPLLDIVPVVGSYEFSQDYDFVIATSQQVFFNEIDFSSLTHIPFCCVGLSTAQKAKNSGFSNIVQSFSKVQDLTDYLNRLNSQPCRVLYLRGADIQYDLAHAFPQFEWDQRIVYKAQEAVHLSSDIIDIIPDLCAVTLFSARTAVVFKRLMLHYGLEAHLKGISLVSISEQVSDCVAELDVKKHLVAPSPDTASLLSVLTSLLREEK